MEEKKNIQAIKAAIYTRKSSEEGLELEFNSLDAQREACESYIKSQKHEGWVLVEKEYSDGGISGGTLNRPALQELLQDIQNGLVDIIVVYKIDRLTRSLHDFSKLVEIFDKHNTSFVSITQQFNTSTSMGRLTLNMLLSFAQFEREVAGERIRDKKLATARKGMWSSGQSPFGYKIVDKKLIPDEEEKPKLCLMFELYKDCKSTGKLKDTLKERNITTRSGKEWKVGALNNLLRRITYIGKIKHKDKEYEGVHESILDEKLFKEVQRIMDDNRLHNGIKTHAKESSLLAGKAFDDRGNAMSPSHSTKNNKRYRYYLSQAYIQQRKEDAGSLAQIPARELEEYICKIVKKMLKESLNYGDYDLGFYKDMKERLNSFCDRDWELIEERFIVREILERVVVSRENVRIFLKRNVLKELAGWIGCEKEVGDFKEPQNTDLMEMEETIQLKRVNKGNVLVIGGCVVNKNNAMIRLIRQSFELHARLLAGELVEDLEKELKVTKRRLDRILYMRFLAPDILNRIMGGQHPENWNTHMLCNCYTMDWGEQREYFKI